MELPETITGSYSDLIGGSEEGGCESYSVHSTEPSILCWVLDVTFENERAEKFVIIWRHAFGNVGDMAAVYNC